MTTSILVNGRWCLPRLPIVMLALAIFAVPLLTAARLPLAPHQRAPSAAAPLAHALPLQFEQNQGQTDPAVRFLARESGGTVFLTADQLVLSLNARGRGGAVSQPPVVVRMGLIGSMAPPDVAGVDPLAAVSNYMVGMRAQWHRDVPNFARVAYRNVYPGIDLVVHGESGAPEYDFVVAAGSNPRAITLNFSGQRGLRLDGSGDLVFDTAAGPLTQHRPLISQDLGSGRHTIPGGFRVLGGGRVAFDIGAYDVTRPLVIDPVIAYSTFLGGGGTSGADNVNNLTVDSAGNAYLVGTTTSTDFPSTTLVGPRNGSDAFVAKLNPSGSAIVWSTVFGGSDTRGDNAEGLALDSSGNVWVSGYTFATDFPTTSTAFEATRTCASIPCRDHNVFVSEFNSTGNALQYSTYLGGHGATSGANTQSEIGWSIAVDSADKAYVTGSTSSPDFPTTSGSFQSTYPTTCCNGVAFVAKFDSSKSGAASLVYSTFVSGSHGSDSHVIAVDAAGEAVIAGSNASTDYPVTSGAFQTTTLSTQGGDGGDGTLTKLNSAGTGLLYSTYIGGSKASPINSVALGPNGRIYLAGRTEASDFPTTAGAFSRSFHGGSLNGLMDDGFLSVIAPNGQGSSDLFYSTYVGGNGDEEEKSVAVDASGNAYLLGFTKSSDWPLLNPVQGVWGGQNLDFQFNSDASVAELRPAGGGASDLVFSTYLGGTGDEAPASVALGPQGAVYAAGSVTGPAGPTSALPVQFPTTRGAARETWAGSSSTSTGFVTKLDPSGTSASLGVVGASGNSWAKNDGGSWAGLGGVLISAPAVVAVPAAGGEPTALYIGVGSDHNLYVRSATQGWQTLSSSPVSCLDTPGATVTTSGGVSTLTVACEGTDHALWFAHGTATSGSLPTVTGWQGLGGTLSAGPAVAQVGGALTFMVVGGNGSVFSRTTTTGYTATGWGCTAHPALASYRGNAYFACHGGDGALWYAVNAGSGWTQPRSAGGSILDGPAIAATPAEVVIYVEGTDHAVYHTTISPGGGPAMPYVADGGSIQFGTGATTLTP